MPIQKMGQVKVHWDDRHGKKSIIRGSTSTVARNEWSIVNIRRYWGYNNGFWNLVYHPNADTEIEMIIGETLIMTSFRLHVFPCLVVTYLNTFLKKFH